MTDKTNPRAELDMALAEMRRTNNSTGSAELITMEATVVCAEALSLLVDAHLATAPEPEPATAPEPEPEPDPRESLPDETPVGNGWVLGWSESVLFKPYGNGRFTPWLEAILEWGAEGFWRNSELRDPRPATVGDLRRMGLPTSEWPDTTAPDPEPEPEPETLGFLLAEPPDGSVVLVGGIAWQRLGGHWRMGGVALHYTWADLRAQGTPTVIYTPEEAP